MGKSTISMAIFNSYVKLPEGTTKTDYTLTHNDPLFFIALVRFNRLATHDIWPLSDDPMPVPSPTNHHSSTAITLW
jgi:hypothetical protein